MCGFNIYGDLKTDRKPENFIWIKRGNKKKLVFTVFEDSANIDARLRNHRSLNKVTHQSVWKHILGLLTKQHVVVVVPFSPEPVKHTDLGAEADALVLVRRRLSDPGELHLVAVIQTHPQSPEGGGGVRKSMFTIFTSVLGWIYLLKSMFLKLTLLCLLTFSFFLLVLFCFLFVTVCVFLLLLVLSRWHSKIRCLISMGFTWLNKGLNK